MGIKRVTIRNFRSYDYADIELGKFNIFIGANASGKSNFLQVFRFLRDIVRHGLENAISMQGGVEFLRNVGIDASNDEVSFSVSCEVGTGWLPLALGLDESFPAISPKGVDYKLSIVSSKARRRFRITMEELTLQGQFVRLARKKDGIEEVGRLGVGDIILSNQAAKVSYEIHLPAQVAISQDELFISRLLERKLPEGESMIEKSSGNIWAFPLTSFLEDISIYDFDPKLPQKAVPITGKKELEEDGSNLAIVLSNILRDDKKRRKLSNLITDLLPFVQDLRVEKFADKSLLFKLREVYCPNVYLPASLISDGTISITALIVALYLEEKPLAILEEPTRNVHPFLISKLVNMLKEASQKKQIIVTTHNPEMVKYADLNDIVLISRNEQGFSEICRPAQKEEVKIFLQNEIGIDELYVQNLLGV